jgi:hypothetical protein
MPRRPDVAAMARRFSRPCRPFGPGLAVSALPRHLSASAAVRFFQGDLPLQAEAAEIRLEARSQAGRPIAVTEAAC